MLQDVISNMPKRIGGTSGQQTNMRRTEYNKNMPGECIKIVE